MISLDQLKKSYSETDGEITLNVEDVEVLVKAFELACGYLYTSTKKVGWEEVLLKEASNEKA